MHKKGKEAVKKDGRKPIEISSRKAKGRNLQNKVRDLIFEHCLTPMCEVGDIRTALMGESGPDIIMSPKAKNHWRLGPVECKNQEKLNVWAGLRHAEKHGGNSLLVFKRNNTKIYCALELETLLKLL